jgi:hypothetical protein
VTNYHLAGAINGALFVLALTGLASQIATIWSRKARGRAASADHPTALLSLNYFAVSFLAYFAFFLYGYSLSPFNHYLVWPRLLGCVLVLVVLFEIARGRRTRTSRAVAGVAAGLLAGGLVLLVHGGEIHGVTRGGPQALSVVATALISQSLWHQIVAVRGAGQIGAVSWHLHFLTLVKDLSTVVFGLTMGLGFGWPLVVMGGASAGLKLVLLGQLRALSAQATS